jgi:hypothetical protein
MLPLGWTQMVTGSSLSRLSQGSSKPGERRESVGEYRLRHYRAYYRYRRIGRGERTCLFHRGNSVRAPSE